MENYKLGKQLEPRLYQSLEQMLKYVSYNRQLQLELGKKSNQAIVESMKLHEICLDFENKSFPGREGYLLH